MVYPPQPSLGRMLVGQLRLVYLKVAAGSTQMGGFTGHQSHMDRPGWKEDVRDMCSCLMYSWELTRDWGALPPGMSGHAHEPRPGPTVGLPFLLETPTPSGDFQMSLTLPRSACARPRLEGAPSCLVRTCGQGGAATDGGTRSPYQGLPGGLGQPFLPRAELQQASWASVFYPSC